MWNGFIGQQIRRSDRNMLLANLTLLLVPLTIGMMSPRYWQNFALGPFPKSQQELLSIQDPDEPQHYFVTVEGDKSIDTGLQQITKRVSKYTGTVRSQQVSARYVALVLDQKLLIVKANTDNASSKTFTGSLAPIPNDVQSKIIGTAQDPEVKQAFLPYMLVEDDFRTAGYIGLAIAIPSLLLAGWNLQNVARRWGKPEKHPITQSLAKFGSSAETAIAKVDQEIAATDSTLSIGATQITSSWVIRKGTYGLDIMPLDQLVWVYKTVTSRKGVKSYSALLCDRQKRQLVISGNETQVNQMLEAIVQRAPWVIAGYSEEVKTLWQKEPTTVVEAVDQRRQQFSS